MKLRQIPRLIPMLPAILLLTGCFQGMPKEKPPIHLNPNMDTQGKYKPQRISTFFEDGSSMRPAEDGTVALDELREDPVYYTGKTAAGVEVEKSPVAFSSQVLARGQERFNIYCSPCHGAAGDGQGIIMKYKYPIPPTSVHDPRIRTASDGYIFNVISNGIRNMPSYKEQIPVADRWAIIGYVRALQLSQNATLKDVPAEIRPKL